MLETHFLHGKVHAYGQASSSLADTICSRLQAPAASMFSI